MRTRKLRKRLRKKIGTNGRFDAKGRLIFVATYWYRGEYRECRSVCRLDQYEDGIDERGDPIMDASGCLGDFVRDWAADDRRKGCPKCKGEY